MEAHIEEVPTNTKRDKGFTLVELLIVIVILGVLATVTVFAVGGITDKAKENVACTDVASVAVAAESYFTVNGVYPANIAALVPTFIKETPKTAVVYVALPAGGPYTSYTADPPAGTVCA